MAYEEKVVPSETRYLWSAFDTPPIREAELQSNPTIMLLGQYSVGKTSMISYLLGSNYPGADIGPEPTTDIFAHITYSEEPHTISGSTLSLDSNYQFQVASRGYDFSAIIKFLANKVDRIILLFDANKLDISDEYKQVIQILQGNEEKIKIVLNKADSVKPRELIHVRGALMWALGKIMKCPEVPKVYIGSFWPYWNDKNVLFREAIQEDLDALIDDMLNLQNNYHLQRVNDVCKRARNLRLHSYVMDEIMRSTFFFKSKKEATDTETTPAKLAEVYNRVARLRRVVLSDFPDPNAFHEKAKKDFNELRIKVPETGEAEKQKEADIPKKEGTNSEKKDEDAEKKENEQKKDADKDKDAEKKENEKKNERREEDVEKKDKQEKKDEKKGENVEKKDNEENKEERKDENVEKKDNEENKEEKKSENVEKKESAEKKDGNTDKKEDNEKKQTDGEAKSDAKKAKDNNKEDEAKNPEEKSTKKKASSSGRSRSKKGKEDESESAKKADASEKKADASGKNKQKREDGIEKEDQKSKSTKND